MYNTRSQQDLQDRLSFSFILFWMESYSFSLQKRLENMQLVLEFKMKNIFLLKADFTWLSSVTRIGNGVEEF